MMNFNKKTAKQRLRVTQERLPLEHRIHLEMAVEEKMKRIGEVVRNLTHPRSAEDPVFREGEERALVQLFEVLDRIDPAFSNVVQDALDVYFESGGGTRQEGRFAPGEGN